MWALDKSRKLTVDNFHSMLNVMGNIEYLPYSDGLFKTN